MKNLITAQVPSINLYFKIIDAYSFRSMKDETILEQKIEKWVSCDKATKDNIRAGVSLICAHPVSLLTSFLTSF